MDWNKKNSHQDKEYVPPGVCPHLTTQAKLNNHICALNLSNIKAARMHPSGKKY
jgi:hypothetical protein